MNAPLQQDLIKFLEVAWIPVVEVIAGLLLGPQVKKMIIRVGRKSTDKGVVTFLGSAANMIIIVIAFVLAAEALGVKMNSVIALLSALGLGISLALKENMANVAGGIQILITKPFQVNDYIKIDNHKGTVTAVDIMFTTLRTDNSKEVIIPNSTIVSDTLVNYSRYPSLRLKVHFSLPVGQSLEKIRKTVCQKLDKNPYLLHDQPVDLKVQSVNYESINFEIIAHVLAKNFEIAKQQINEDLCTTLPLYNTPNSGVETVMIKDPELKVDLENDHAANEKPNEKIEQGQSGEK